MRTVALLLSVLVLATAPCSVWAQSHPAGGPAPGGAVPQAGAPVIPDTAVARFILPEGVEAPLAWTAGPDTVSFGGRIILEPAGETAGPVTLTTDVDWLAPVGKSDPGFLGRLLGREGLAPALPTFLVYRTDPFRVAVGEWESGVIHVRGRASGTGEVAGVRTPPFPGWPWMRLALLALAGGLLAFILVWLWDRRRGPVVWPDRPVAASVWLDTAPGFRDLLTEGALARGDARAFLDGLAGLARRYVGGRYGIPALEMTGPEMIAACRRLGYPLEPVRRLAGLVDEADRRRYDPDPPTPAWCRDKAVGFFGSVQATRILPGPTPVAQESILEAEKAWTAVARELDPTGRLMTTTREGKD